MDLSLTRSPEFDKIRDLYYALRISNIKGVLIWINIDAFTISIPKKYGVEFQSVTKFLSVLTIVPDNREQRENQKFAQKQPYFLKLYIKSGSNKPTYNRVTR